MELSTSYTALSSANNNMYNKFEFTFEKGKIYNITWSANNDDSQSGTVIIELQ